MEERLYTIKYSKAGIYQYADFHYKDDVLVYNSFYPNWVKKGEIPSFENVNKIDEVLDIIRKFSYGNNAEIYKINHVLLDYYNNVTIEDELIDYSNKFNNFINSITLEFFKNNILPILKKNKWKITYSRFGHPVLAIKKNGEWDNVLRENKDSIFTDYMCHKFLNDVMNIFINISDQNEMGSYSSENFAIFMKYISNNDLTKLKIFFEL